jgi:hypothetical protein
MSTAKWQNIAGSKNFFRFCTILNSAQLAHWAEIQNSTVYFFFIFGATLVSYH